MLTPEQRETLPDSFTEIISTMSEPPQLEQPIPEDIPEEEIPAFIAKQPNGSEVIKQWRRQMADAVANLLIESLPSSPNTDLALAQRLSAAGDTKPESAAIEEDEEVTQFLEALQTLPEPFRMRWQMATACHIAGLHQPAKMLLTDLAYEVLIDSDQGFQQLLAGIHGAEQRRKKAQAAARKGRDNRWEARDLTKAYALKLYRNRSFKNASQAAEQLYPEIVEYGESVNWRFNSLLSGMNTVRDWFLEADKNSI